MINSVLFCVNLFAKCSHVYPVFYIFYFWPNKGPVSPQLPALLPLDDEAATEYKAEKILDSRLRYLGIENLVNWVGYDVFISMWEPTIFVFSALDVPN